MNASQTKQFFKININEISSIFDETKSQLNLDLSNDQIISAYKTMESIRKFEERAADLYAKKHIRGFCHLYNGQEAIITGNVMAAHEGDSYITSYRDHGMMIGCGGDPLKVMSELTGKIDGYSKGKGGSMHIFDLEKKFYGGHGIVGAQTSLGTGIAFAIKYKQEPNVCYTYLGDGAANQGQFYESMNMAALWKLPVIYVIENNGYAMGTSVSRAVYDDHFFNRGLPFGIIGIDVDGMDFFDVYKKMKIARDYCIKNEMPVLLEMKTYRYRGHSMSDPAKYRTKEEVDSYKELDPIQKLRKHILDNKIMTEDECEKISDEISSQMKKVADKASSEETSYPGSEELWTDIYA
jgi:pyruvate dehydrogenase E1 component alpha subunit